MILPLVHRDCTFQYELGAGNLNGAPAGHVPTVSRFVDICGDVVGECLERACGEGFKASRPQCATLSIPYYGIEKRITVQPVRASISAAPVYADGVRPSSLCFASSGISRERMKSCITSLVTGRPRVSAFSFSYGSAIP